MTHLSTLNIIPSLEVVPEAALIVLFFLSALLPILFFIAVASS